MSFVDELVEGCVAAMERDMHQCHGSRATAVYVRSAIVEALKRAEVEVSEVVPIDLYVDWSAGRIRALYEESSGEDSP